MILRIVLSAVALLVLPFAAQAACTSPAGAEATMVYNGPYHVMQFCNGTDWVSMAGGSVVYSAGGSTNPVFTAANGYLVLTSGSWTGNLGGLTGADAKCLSDLTANNWNGKSAAQGFGVLNATHVHAWLCDGSTCNLATASKDYYFANSADSTAGGSYTTVSSGQNVGAFGGYYTSDNVSWGALSTFNTNTFVWTNLGSYYQSTGGANSTATGYTCQNWTDGTAGSLAGYGSTGASDNSRWATGNAACNTTKHLYCLVNP